MRRTIDHAWRLGCLIAATAAALLAGLAVYFALNAVSWTIFTSPTLFVEQFGAFLAAWWEQRPAYTPLALATIAAAILFLEKLEFRTWTAHAIMATITAMVLIFTVTDTNLLMHGSQIQIATRCLVAAFISGVVYWALAGRRAGTESW